MPGLTHKTLQSHHLLTVSQVTAAGSGVDTCTRIWSRSDTDDISFSQLQKFWSELSSAARRELLQIDKPTLFEQVRKNLYCSRCNGLLLEGFSQIVLHSKNLQGVVFVNNNPTAGYNKHICEKGSKGITTGMQDDARDPSVHPWGGLAATRDGMLTILDCFLYEQPLEVLLNVFDSARARERERELLYPDACGGGGRGWIGQGCGIVSGRGYGLKETCALHTAKLSCEALVDFWSALGEEKRKSLLRMKEEDFIERLMFRFDSKRFCRDCRRNVLREFKELKELKRTRREPRCNNSFCTADTALRYEVSDSSIQVDWKECFAGDIGSIYQRFEWGLGSTEGKSDILDFEDVGLSEGARVDGLELRNSPACFITLRAWKRDGRCNELSVKAHAMKGQLCVHRRLIVGNGYVSITIGECIRWFFERAELTEEEEDDDAMDKDGSDPDNEGSRVQKHAKSPELARDFLLDAATVIFKEQVERAFREGTARRNAHTVFVCLALSLLEERLHVACKDITTLEKQNKLLEEEEDEKREEVQKRERKRLKEKGKKMRRKEKIKGKERDKEKANGEAKLTSAIVNACGKEAPVVTNAKQGTHRSDEMEKDDAIDGLLARPSSPDMMDARPSASVDIDIGTQRCHELAFSLDDSKDTLSTRDNNGAFIVEKSKAARRRSRMRKGPFMDTVSKRLSRRSSLKVIEMGGSSWTSMRNAPAASIEISGKVLHNSKSQFKSTTKRDRNVVPKRIEFWNQCFELKKDHQHPESTIQFRTRQSYTSRVVCDSSLIRKKEGEGRLMTSCNHMNATESDVSGSMQASCSSTDSMGLTTSSSPVGHHRLTDTVLPPDRSKDGVQSSSMKVTHIRYNGQCNAFSDKVSLDRGPLNRFSTSSQTCSGKEKIRKFPMSVVNTNLSTNGFSESFEPVAAAEPEFLSNDRVVNRTELHSDGSLDGESSPLSAVSCITDTSDTFSVDNLVSETVFNGVQEGSITVQASCTPGNLLDSHKVEGTCYCDGDQEAAGLSRPILDSVTSDGPVVTETFRELKYPDLNLRPNTFSDTSQTNGYMQCLYQNICQNGMNSGFSPMDMLPPSSNVACPMKVSGLPSSLLSLHFQQNFGYYQVEGQWTTNALPQPNGFFIATPTGSGPSIGGLSTLSLPLSSSFQPFPSVFGLGHSPSFHMESNFIQWKDFHVLSRVGGHIDARNNGSCVGLQCTASSPETRIPLDVSTPIQSTQSSSSSKVKDSSFDASGFSLFHFGSPVAAAVKEQKPFAAGKSEDKSMENVEVSTVSYHTSLQQQSSGVTKMSIPVEEYSLFTATTGNRFSFF